MRGYKVFEPDWTCKGFQYEVGKTYEIEDKPILCKKGFHFCEKAIDCFSFYEFTPDNKVAEVDALGEWVSDGRKSCTNKITILRELSWEEVLRIVNTGRGCTGLGNSGERNSGDCNSGWYNSGSYNGGHHNSGNYNTGNFNSGGCNSGSYNTSNYNSGNRNSGRYNSGCFNAGWGNHGDYNTGDNNDGNYNSGDCNSGNFNSGDFNATNHSYGCFNTTYDTMRMFNQPTNWTMEDWRLSAAHLILARMPYGSERVPGNDMTDEEKAKHPGAKMVGGYLKEADATMRQEWWNGLSDEYKTAVMSLPNFNAEIFEKITGIKI